MDRKIMLFLFGTVIFWASVKAQSSNSAFCQRFPTNSNCRSSSSSSVPSSSSSGQPVNPASLGLAPPPGTQGSSQQQASGNGDPCASWGPIYNKYCLGSNVQDQYKSSCQQFAATCLNNVGGSSSSGGVSPNNVGLPPPPTNGQPQPQGQTQTQQGGLGSQWNTLTQQAQAEQAAQALAAAQNGAANCGQYQQNYNVWCGGVQQVNAVYCNTLGRICAQQAAAAANGQTAGIGGPFANNNGLPTGGAGSTRPLTIGQNLGVGPFFGMDKTLGINPLQGVGQHQGFNVPIAGIGVQSTKGVDYGGLIGVSQLGQLLGGGRRRRSAYIPIGRDIYGNIIYLH